MRDASKPSLVIRNAAPTDPPFRCPAANCKVDLTTRRRIGVGPTRCQTETVTLAAALFAVAALAAPEPAPLVCIDPGHDSTPDLSTERIGPGSSTYKIKDGGGAAGESVVVLQIGF